LLAQCRLPDGPNYRRADFLAGLAAAGFTVVDRVARPGPGDVLMIWNRSPRDELEAQRFASGGAAVLVAENGLFGKQWRGEKWFTLTRGRHAGAGRWPHPGASRWQAWGVDLLPWRTTGTEVVVLEQRGIGEPGVASPHGWAQRVAAAIGGRVRLHPGASQPDVPLADDLRCARCVATWNSSAALQALVLGVPVFFACSTWIGAAAGRHLDGWPGEPRRDDGARLAVFERLAWAMWTADEVRSGAALRHVLTET